MFRSSEFQRKRVFNAPGLAVAVVIALLLGTGSPSAALPTARIHDCYDGDTCTTSTGEKIRLACIDSPELRGKRAEPAAAQAARDYLRSIVANQEVGIQRITTDRYGRTVAELFVGGSNVQQMLVAEGAARIDWKHAHQCSWTR